MQLVEAGEDKHEPGTVQPAQFAEPENDAALIFGDDLEARYQEPDNEDDERDRGEGPFEITHVLLLSASTSSTPRYYLPRSYVLRAAASTAAACSTERYRVRPDLQRDPYRAIRRSASSPARSVVACP